MFGIGFCHSLIGKIAGQPKEAFVDVASYVNLPRWPWAGQGHFALAWSCPRGPILLTFRPTPRAASRRATKTPVPGVFAKCFRPFLAKSSRRAATRRF